MTTTETLTLTDFLLARFADDEAWWNGEGGSWARECQECAALSDFQPGPGLDQMLAECEAKRRIVAIHYNGSPKTDLNRCSPCDTVGDDPCPTLRALALPYADHPDWREEWRVVD